jgi:hypothetical protein
VISCIRDSRVEAPNLCNKNCDIAIRDIPMSPEPSISGDVCQKIQGKSGFGISEVLRTGYSDSLESRSAIFPTGELCGPQQELVEDRWHSIGDREKARPETFGIRIRDPANFEVPTR